MFVDFVVGMRDTLTVEVREQGGRRHDGPVVEIIRVDAH